MAPLPLPLLPLLLVLPSSLLAQTPDFQCQAISIAMCRNIGYNLTLMPNQFHHDTQEEAGLEVHQYWPLVEVGCSPDLQFFLCATYVPICLQQYGRTLPVCREVCQRARVGCEPVMRNAKFRWPDRLECSKLPEYGDTDNLCMDNKNGERVVTDPPDPCACECRPPRAVPLRPSDRLFNRSVSLGGVQECALPCRAPYFSPAQHRFTERWVLGWAALCAASTLLTVATFLIDRSRFPYPERPVIFMAGCYLLVSVGYLVRAGAGHELTACEGGAVRHDAAGDLSYSALCAVVFLLVYFFGMASAVWWVVLSLTWFLAAGLKWGNEVVAGFSPYFHLAAWVIPAAKSIAALAMNAVDGDAMTGVCYIGGRSLANQRWFVLAPLALCLLLGTSFLLAGFVALCRVRGALKQDRGAQSKLERLMVRIGVFSVLYTVPASLVVACLVYEQYQRPAWERALVCPCRHTAVTTFSTNDADAADADAPSFHLFLLRFFMSLAVGVTSAVWVCSRKTLRSWDTLLRCRRPAAAAAEGGAPPPLPPPPGAFGRSEPPQQPGDPHQPLAGGNMACSQTTFQTLSEPTAVASQVTAPLSHV